MKNPLNHNQRPAREALPIIVAEPEAERTMRFTNYESFLKAITKIVTMTNPDGTKTYSISEQSKQISEMLALVNFSVDMENLTTYLGIEWNLQPCIVEKFIQTSIHIKQSY